MNQIRFDGLYHLNNGRLWLRFYPDNVVTGGYLDIKTTPEAAASLIALGQGGSAVGRYALEGESIDIKLKFADGRRHFKGSVTQDGLKLQFQDKGKQNPFSEYSYHSLEGTELEPPQATQVHQLRERMSKGEIDRNCLEAAAAIGDPVAALALRPISDVKEIAKRFAAMDAAACLRVLLALCWSDDGEWYTPQQGNTAGGARDDDEGKVLRSLARWCLKPEAKLIAKAKEQFADVIHVGAGSEFLDGMLRLVQARDEASRANIMKETLKLHLVHDVAAGYERVRAKLVPWLLGTGDPLAEMMKNIK